jgi:hypothetical protein
VTTRQDFDFQDALPTITTIALDDARTGG